MTDRKAVIKNADMSEDMQQDAVECATQALEKYNIEKDIAAFIKKVTAHFQLHPVQRRGRELSLWLKILFFQYNLIFFFFFFDQVVLEKPFSTPHHPPCTLIAHTSSLVFAIVSTVSKETGWRHFYILLPEQYHFLSSTKTTSNGTLFLFFCTKI